MARPGPTFIRPLVDFLRTEAAGGVVLVAATLAALVWANSPWDAGYRALWDTRLAFSLGDHSLDLDLRTWVSDGLMALFFLVVGLTLPALGLAAAYALAAPTSLVVTAGLLVVHRVHRARAARSAQGLRRLS